MHCLSLIHSYEDGVVHGDVYLNAKGMVCSNGDMSYQRQESNSLCTSSRFYSCLLYTSDLQTYGFDTRSVTDAQMRRLAQKMANDYCEQLFWSSMEIIAERCV